MQILSYNQCANRAGITRRTFEREIANGRGPAIVEISARRRGVLETDFEEWLLSRRRPAPVPATLRRGPGRPRKVEPAALSAREAQMDAALPRVPEPNSATAPRMRITSLQTISAASRQRRRTVLTRDRPHAPTPWARYDRPSNTRLGPSADLPVSQLSCRQTQRINAQRTSFPTG
jgi:hypothetical protein